MRRILFPDLYFRRLPSSLIRPYQPELSDMDMPYSVTDSLDQGVLAAVGSRTFSTMKFCSTPPCALLNDIRGTEQVSMETYVLQSVLSHKKTTTATVLRAELLMVTGSVSSMPDCTRTVSSHRARLGRRLYF